MTRGGLVLLTLLALTAGAPAPLLAQVSGPPAGTLDLDALTRPTFSAFSVRDGLPSAVISSVLDDADGFVWAALPEGLARWDGHRWTSGTPLTPQGQFGSLTRTADGSLWVAFRDRGLMRLEAGTWHPVPVPEAAGAYRLVETTEPTGEVVRWLLTTGWGLLRQNGTEWEPLTLIDGDVHLPLSLAQTRELGHPGRIWAGMHGEGLWYLDARDGTWEVVDAPELAHTHVVDLLVTEEGGSEQLWIATNASGLWRLDADGLRHWSVAAGNLPSDAVYRLESSPAGAGRRFIWVATRAGLARIHDAQVEWMDHRDGLPANGVRDVRLVRGPGDVQVLWAATDNGIARAILRGVPWRVVPVGGATTNGVFAVLVEPDGRGGERLWTGAREHGLVVHEDGKWREYGADDGLPYTTVRMIKRLPDGAGGATLWLGFANGGLVRVDPGRRFVPVPGPWPRRPAEAVTDLLEREVRGVRERWVATRTTGLYRWRRGEWTRMGEGVPRLRRWSVWGLVEQHDAAGRSWLWGASSHGLVRIGEDSFEILRQQLPDLYPGGLHGISLLVDAGRPVLWLGTDHGVQRVDVSNPAAPRILPQTLPPPPDPLVYNVRRDSRGRTWVCTNNGIQLLQRAAAGWTTQVFTRRDGLPHDECNSNAQFIDAHDRYWAGMLGGLGVYDPATASLDQTAKPLHLTRISVDGVPVEADRAVLAPGAGNLEVQLALLSWRDEDLSEFRSQLVGLEREPTPWSVRNLREFPRLPPGDYSLRVEARDYAGNRSAPLELPVTVLPHWWQTGAARLLGIFCAGLVLYLLLRWRVRTLEARQRELRKQVAARTRELHDANIRLTALSYRDALTHLANRRRFRDALEAATRAAGGGSWGLLFVDVDNFKAYNDRFGHPAGDAALCSVAAAMLDCVPDATLVARYGGEEFACLLPEADAGRTFAIGEAVRAAVAARDVPVPGTGRVQRVTVSVGVASGLLRNRADGARLLHAADQAMYRAKASGRNCVRA